MNRLFSSSLRQSYEFSANSLRMIERVTGSSPIRGYVYELLISIGFPTRAEADLFITYLNTASFDMKSITLKRCEPENTFEIQMLGQKNMSRLKYIFWLQQEESFPISQDSLNEIKAKTDALPIRGSVNESNISLLFSTKDEAELLYHYLLQNHHDQFAWMGMILDQNLEGNYLVDIRGKTNKNVFQGLFNLHPELQPESKCHPFSFGYKS